MKGTTRIQRLLALATLAYPLATTAAQLPPVSKVPPQDQAAELRASTDGLYNKKLRPTEEALRKDVILLRDSLDVVIGYANRLERAANTAMPSVAASAIKELGGACNAASRTAAVIRPRLQALKIIAADRTQQQRTTKVLDEYRAVFEAVAKLMTACPAEAGALANAKTASPTQQAAFATKLTKGIRIYEATLRNTLNDFDIPLRPKQQGGH